MTKEELVTKLSENQDKFVKEFTYAMAKIISDDPFIDFGSAWERILTDAGIEDHIENPEEVENIARKNMELGSYAESLEGIVEFYFEGTLMVLEESDTDLF